MKYLSGFLVCFSLLLQPVFLLAEDAKQPAMKPYSVSLPYVDDPFEMLPIPGGVFKMGSPATEENRRDDEGPQHLVKIEPFWMAKCEATWNQYNTFRYQYDQLLRQETGADATENESKADAVSRPSGEYRDMSKGMGVDGYPAINMTQYAAKTYCQWLSAITGDYYRLPTEAEWEYACRAGTTTAYSFGDDASQLDQYAWFYPGSTDDPKYKYHQIGLKNPNPWGLHDMHGNVSEWCLDQYHDDYYKNFNPNVPAIFPIAIPKTLYPRVTRGGSWDHDPEDLRSASREKSDPKWKIRDPQNPRSKWYHVNSDYVGFRVIRPLKRPTDKGIKKYVLHPDLIVDRQSFRE